MATKQMTIDSPAPVVLMGLGMEMIDTIMKPPVAKKKLRSNGKALSEASVSGIYQNHRADTAAPGADIDIVLL